MPAIKALVPGLGPLEAQCGPDAEPIRCLLWRYVGPWLRLLRPAPMEARKPVMGVLRAGTGPAVITDYESAYLTALYWYLDYRLCVTADGKIGPCEAFGGRPVGHDIRPLRRFLGRAMSAIRLYGRRWLYVPYTGTRRSQFALYQRFDGPVLGPRVFDTAHSALRWALQTGARGLIIRVKDLLKYGLLTALGYAVHTEAGHAYWIPVSAVAYALWADLQAAGRRAYSAHVDSIRAEEEVSTTFPAKVEDRGEGLMVANPVFLLSRKAGLWLVGDCDAFDPSWVLMCPWCHGWDTWEPIAKAVDAGMADRALYPRAVGCLEEGECGPCREYLAGLQRFLIVLGIELRVRPGRSAQVKDRKPGKWRPFERGWI